MTRFSVGVKLADRYEILAPLGSGGMGEVFHARDNTLGRDVAVKVLPEHLLTSPEASGRLEREGKALAALSHPNIVTIYDFGRDGDSLFAVTELLQGQTLREVIGHSSLPRNRAIDIAASVAEGISAAHSRGIVHRDLKPENIFLTTKGEIKILDFGLARLEKYVSPGESSIFPTAPTATEPGMVLGTIQYMSPEQVRGQSVDARTDIFSLGCILYEMLTGSRPFSASTPADAMALILTQDPPEVRQPTGRIPDDALAIVQRCLKKNPDERFQSARDLAFSLRSLLTQSVQLTAAQVPRLQKISTPRKGRTPKRPVDSIAVLPLSNASGDPDLEYFSDGITESIINSLSQTPKLRVMARSTVFRYKGQEPDPLQVGTDLNVRSVLTGRVINRGQTLNLQAELVDVSDGSQLWGEQYNRRLSDIFSVQEEISQEISNKLRLKLSGDEKSRLTKRYTEDTEAYQLYLKGRFYWNKRNEEGLKRGIDYFQQAIDKDPGYALAYAGLADAYNLLSAYGLMAPKEAIPIAKAAAIRAVELDLLLAEAHEALAHVKMLYDWDWEGAEKEFERAIKLNPNYATAHQRYAIFLALLGRNAEAMQEIDKAQKLDPLSLIINTDVALILYFQEESEQALEQCRKTLELDPNFSVARFVRAITYEQIGKFEEAIAEAEQGMKSSGDRAFISVLGHIYAVMGKKDKALEAVNELLQLSSQRYVPSYRLAIVYCGLGEFDKAFEFLEQSYAERSVWLVHVHLRVDPRLAPLQQDPRFLQLLKRMDLPSY